MATQPTQWKPQKRRPNAFELWPGNVQPSAHEYKPNDKLFAETANDNAQAVAGSSEDRLPRSNSPRPGLEPVHNAHLNPTCVTPLIAELAAPYFADLRVAGSKIERSIDGLIEKRIIRHPVSLKYLQRLFDVHYGPSPEILYNNNDVIRKPGKSSTYTFHTRVQVRKEIINVGDVVIVAAGRIGKNGPYKPLPRDLKKLSKLAPKPHAGMFFWFGKVRSIRRDNNSFHAQWFEHGCKTVLEELAHPQELFLTTTCDDVSLKNILTKCMCVQVKPGERPKSLQHHEFFFSLSYEHASGSFVDNSDLADTLPYSCPLCAARDAKDDMQDCKKVVNRRRQLFGFSHQGEEIHYRDVILIRSSKGPCHIGQIVKIVEHHETGYTDYKLTVKLFGRITERSEAERHWAADEYEDRRLFLTEEFINTTSSQVIGKCYVLTQRMPKEHCAWLEAAPNHFFFYHRSRRRDNEDGQSPLVTNEKPFKICGDCVERRIIYAEQMFHFKQKSKLKPLRVFDPFAGVGAFALGMSGSGCMKLTHAIEINTSAARTLKHNSPDTVVYNQCANVMLEQIVRSDDEVIESLDIDVQGHLPPLPKPGEIDCIVSGFPCQPHSSLNRHVKARDLLNELFLNTISWVDYLRPDYCIFENVKGFVEFRLLTTQNDSHTVRGGIEKGGIKFITRALVTMGYQVRFGLLQAAHYGVPQSRIRFFLWAAKSGCSLPHFPQPEYESQNYYSNKIAFQHAVIAPAVLQQGSSLYPPVTIEDAIHDLKRWDWKLPDANEGQYEPPQEPPYRRDIRKVKCDNSNTRCGPSLREDEIYDHPPRSAFQKKCRSTTTSDIQHYTTVFAMDVVERVVNIGLEQGSDYKSLNDKPKLWEYQTFDTNSANARDWYKPGMYGRLTSKEQFNTIVTNVAPTAKQCRIINPWCRRILSVRELARAQGFPDRFKFIAADRKVVSMHRQIGNAVPWQLAEALSRELQRSIFDRVQKEVLDVLYAKLESELYGTSSDKLEDDIDVGSG